MFSFVTDVGVTETLSVQSIYQTNYQLKIRTGDTSACAGPGGQRHSFQHLRFLLSYFWEFDAMFGNQAAVGQGGSPFQCDCMCMSSVYTNPVLPEMIVSLQHRGCETSLHSHARTYLYVCH